MNKKDPITDTINGIEVDDPYRWLEDSSDDEVQDWVRRQNKRVDKELKSDEFDILAEEMEERYQTTNFSTPLAVNGRYFYEERKPEQDQWVLYVKSGLDAEPQVICDPNGKKEENTLTIDYWEVSRTSRYVAFGISEDGNEMATLFIYDAENGKRLQDKIVNCRYSSVAWLSDESGFYYTRNPRPGTVPEDEMHMHSKVFFHQLGDDPADDVLIFGEDRPKDDMIRLDISPDDRYVSIRVGQDWSENDIFIYETQEDALTKVIAGEEFYSDVSFLEDKVLLYTNYQADNGRILANAYEDIFAPIDAWGELVPEREYPLESYAVSADHILVHYLVDAASEVAVFDHDGKKQSDIPLEDYASVIGIRADRDEEEFFYSTHSFVRPRATYRHNPETDTHEKYRETENPLNPDDYTVEQKWCESAGGTEVPMFVVHHQDVELGGDNPTILWGYGGYGVSPKPGFSRGRISWLKRGGVYALANIRGGGEFGESWHQEGIKEDKTNTFDDLIAAGQVLIEQDYTRPKHLGIHGGSNGGLTVGAAGVQRPDLFQAVCAEVPLLDIVRFHKFGMAVRWIHEYGNPEDADDLERILEWSPYHNVEDDTLYPHFLLTTAEQDSRVHPMHARKMAALLEEKNTKRDTYLYTEKKAGHGPGMPIHKIVQKQAIIYSFFAQKLGLSM